VELARKHYHETSLVTDDLGAELLVDRVGLHFDSVSLSLNALGRTNPDWWAIGKLHAYAEQLEQFVHIDNDVFLWEPLDPRLNDSGIFSQHPEVTPCGASYYRPESIESDLRALGGWMPDEFIEYLPIDGMLIAANCGILGGRNTAFIRHYANQAITLITHRKNQEVWRQRSGIDQDMVTIEQLMAAACVSYHQGRKGSAYSDISMDYLFASYEDALLDADKVGYTHLIAGSKRNPHLCECVDHTVKARFPQLYERAVSVDQWLRDLIP
jgi:hypothetical protein